MTLRTLTLTAAVLALGTSAFAQTAPPTTPPAKKPGLFSRLFHHPKPGTTRPGMTPMHTGPAMMPGTAYPGHHRMMGSRPMMGSATPMSGGIIGNKNSHVYHLPGDKGMMPGAANRVYFRTEAEAQAAGYHLARTAHGNSSTGTMAHSRKHRMMPATSAPAPQ